MQQQQVLQQPRYLQQQQQRLMLSPAASLDGSGIDASELNGSLALLHVSNNSGSDGNTIAQPAVAAVGSVSCPPIGNYGVQHQSNTASFNSSSGSMCAFIGLGVLS
jgi:hypothetical protein